MITLILTFFAFLTFLTLVHSQYRLVQEFKCQSDFGTCGPVAFDDGFNYLCITGEQKMQFFVNQKAQIDSNMTFEPADGFIEDNPFLKDPQHQTSLVQFAADGSKFVYCHQNNSFNHCFLFGVEEASMKLIRNCSISAPSGRKSLSINKKNLELMSVISSSSISIYNVGKCGNSSFDQSYNESIVNFIFTADSLFFAVSFVGSVAIYSNVGSVEAVEFKQRQKIIFEGGEIHQAQFRYNQQQLLICATNGTNLYLLNEETLYYEWKQSYVEGYISPKLTYSLSKQINNDSIVVKYSRNNSEQQLLEMFKLYTSQGFRTAHLNNIEFSVNNGGFIATQDIIVSIYILEHSRIRQSQEWIPSLALVASFLIISGFGVCIWKEKQKGKVDEMVGNSEKSQGESLI